MLVPILALAALAQQVSPEDLMSAGKFEQALEIYREGAAKSPKSAALWQGAGAAADLLGRYDEAHKFYEQAIKAASAPLDNVAAQRAMAISWAFTGDCKTAERYSRRAFEFYMSIGDRSNAAEAANEIGRICLESGDMNRANDWYDRGHTTIIEDEDVKPARLDLFSFRWLNAKARIAARQGKHDEARKLVARAKAIIDKRRIPDQESYFNYLMGYTLFYAGDYKGAIAQLTPVLPNDVFVLNLIAQAYEKLGDQPNATAYYRKVASVTTHTLNAALAQPFALRKLGLRK